MRENERKKEEERTRDRKREGQTETLVITQIFGMTGLFCNIGLDSYVFCLLANSTERVDQLTI